MTMGLSRSWGPDPAKMTKRILGIARPQGGHVTHAQLTALGLSPEAIRHAIRTGFLIPVYRGVYAIGRLPSAPFEKAQGALLAAGPASGLFGPSAEHFWGMTTAWADPIHVFTPTHRRPRGLTVHRITGLLAIDTIILTIPGHSGEVRLTSRARTLLDRAPRLTPDVLTREVNHQRLAQGVRLSVLRDTVERFPCHPGARRLREIVQAAPAEPFRSGWEMEWPEYARAHDIPAYDMNVPLAPGLIADVVIRPRLLVIELDGWETHGVKAAFQNDRGRDRRLYAELGIPTFRITHDDFTARPTETAATLLRIIARRRTEVSPTREPY
jgi:hypothetical protein